MTIQKILVVHHVRTTPQKGLLQCTMQGETCVLVNHALRAMHLKFVDLIVWNCLSLQQSHRAVQDKLKPTYH
jgi:hypothetical protein